MNILFFIFAVINSLMAKIVIESYEKNCKLITHFMECRASVRFEDQDK